MPHQNDNGSAFTISIYRLQTRRALVWHFVLGVGKFCTKISGGKNSSKNRYVAIPYVPSHQIWSISLNGYGAD